MTDRPRRLIPAPSLQQLVELAGGYHNITPEAWRRFDADMKRWQAALRKGELEMPQSEAVP